MRLSRITEAARQRWYDKLAAAQEEIETLAAELRWVQAVERAEQARKDAEHQAEIDAHLAKVYERQRKIMETAGKLAIFVGTKPEDWVEWNGELVVAPRDIAEATGLDVRVATANVAEWKAEPTFVGGWAVPTAESQNAAAVIGAERAARGIGVIPYLDFDQIWDEDWG